MQVLTGRSAQLLDLPDDVLYRIMLQLGPEQPSQMLSRARPKSTPVLGYFGRQGPAAFQLGVTCTRLYGLFKRTLIKLITPSLKGGLYKPYYARKVLSDSELGRHLFVLIRWAGEHLRVLRIAVKVPNVGRVLRELVQNCPNLTEVWYTDDGLLDWRPQRALFTSLSLTKVRLIRPSTSFISLAEARSLQDLEIDVTAEMWKPLEKVLRTAGKHLERLRINFYEPTNRRWRDYSNVATYLRANLHCDLPVLKALYLSHQEIPREILFPFHTEQPVSVPSAVVMRTVQEPLSRQINEARERNSTENSTGLSQITLSVDTGDALQCAGFFLRFLCPGTIFELLLPQQRFIWR